MTYFSLFEDDPTKVPKLTHLTLCGISSSGGSRRETTTFMSIFFGSEPPKTQESSRFVRILVLFLRHKGMQGVNDIRSLEEDAKGRNPSKSGRLKPWPSYTYFLSASKELAVISIHCLWLEIYRFQQLWLEAPFKKSLTFSQPMKKNVKEDNSLQFTSVGALRKQSWGPFLCSVCLARVRVLLGAVTGTC